MINQIRIRNYKLFKDFSCTNIPQILLIGGKNNTGKTSFLEALFFPLDFNNPLMFLRHFSWRGLDSVATDMESLFAPSYHSFDLKESIVFEYNIGSEKKRLEYKFKALNSQNFSSNNVIELNKDPKSQSGIEIRFGVNKDKKALLKYQERGLSLNIDQSLREYNGNISAHFVSENITLKENAHRYGQLDRDGDTEDLLQALQILEPKLRSLSVIPMGKRLVIYGDVGVKQKIPLALIGQGLNHLLSILLVISKTKNGLVLVDELERGFHHSVLPEIWKVISLHAKKHNTQVAATTHSRELIAGALAGIPQEMKDQFKYMRIDKKEDNELTAKMYDWNILKSALSAELEIR